MSIESIPHRLRLHARVRPQAPAYYERGDDGWRASTWRTYADEVEQAGRAMIHLGVGSADAPAILGFNAPSWSIVLLAGMMIGGKPTGIYTTNSADEVRYVVDHAESPILFLENAAQWEKVRRVRDRLPQLRHVVLFRGQPSIADADVLTWDEFMAFGISEHQVELLDRLEGVDADTVATLIYTSGTTGPPKAVMLTHGNLRATAEIALQMAHLGHEDRMLSYLPLSHIAEQVFSVHGPVFIGCSTYFATSLEDLADNLREVQPTVLFGVPRVWEKIHDGILGQLRAATGVKKRLAQWALSVGERAAPYLLKDETPPGWLGAQFRVADRLVFSKIKHAVGLADNHLAISGAAPILPEVMEFFLSIHVPIQEVYGQSEDTGPTSFNRRGEIRLRTVGRAVPSVQIRIADDGEVMVKGPNVFSGYYKDQEATDRALSPDGWLHSGDLGTLDDDGYLRIIGRKKDILITAGGKNIAPNNLERALKRHAMINDAVVIGDGQRYLTALITLEEEHLAAWARAQELTPADAAAHPALRAEIQGHVDAINTEFARVEQIKKFTVLARNFSVETGELTPSLKVKRRVIYTQYATEIEAMYA